MERTTRGEERRQSNGELGVSQGMSQRCVGDARTFVGDSGTFVGDSGPYLWVLYSLSCFALVSLLRPSKKGKRRSVSAPRASSFLCFPSAFFEPGKVVCEAHRSGGGVNCFCFEIFTGWGDISAQQLPSKCAWGAGVDR